MDVEPHILWARSARGPVSAESYSDADEITCYECAEVLQYVKAHPRTLKGGKRIPVSAHFRHNPHSERTCAGETAAHRAAKDFLCRNDCVFSFQCKECTVTEIIEFPGVKMEECAWGKYRIDVGVLDSSNTLSAAIEVLHTHKTTPEKLYSLQTARVRWAEVRAQDVLARKKNPIPVFKAYTDLCTECVISNQEKVQALIARKHEERVEEGYRELQRAELKAWACREGITLTTQEEDVFLCGDVSMLTGLADATVLAISGAPDSKTQQDATQAVIGKVARVVEAVKQQSSHIVFANLQRAELARWASQRNLHLASHEEDVFLLDHPDGPNLDALEATTVSNLIQDAGAEDEARQRARKSIAERVRRLIAAVRQQKESLIESQEYVRAGEVLKSAGFDSEILDIADDTFVLPRGKYTGLPLRLVWDIDPSYVIWLRTSGLITKELKKEAFELSG